MFFFVSVCFFVLNDVRASSCAKAIDQTSVRRVYKMPRRSHLGCVLDNRNPFFLPWAFAAVDFENTASQKLLISAGYEREGVLRQRVTRSNGNQIDMVMFAALNQSWVRLD